MAFSWKVLGLLLVSLLTFLSTVAAKRTHLFGADPSGGLWGASLDTSASGAAKKKSAIGYPSFSKSIGVSSYDPVRKQVLLELFEPHSLAYGPLCRDTSEFTPETLFSLEMGPYADPMYGDCMGCKASGYTLFDSKIYFMLSGDYMASGVITRRVELRVLDPCDVCMPAPATENSETGFHVVLNCSRHVTDILYRSFPMEDVDDVTLSPGGVLKIVQSGDKLSFFVQLVNKTGSEDSGVQQFAMSLHHATDAGQVKILHTLQMDSRYGSWDIRSLGGVDYKDGTICWSMIDRLYCGSYDIDTMSLEDTNLALRPGMAPASQVCTGSNLEVLGVVTGVSILDTQERTVAFGCYPQSPGSGGTGLIKLASGEILPIKDGDDPLLAGSVFQVDSLPGSCSSEPTPKFCLPLPPTTVAPSKAPEAEGSKTESPGGPEGPNETTNEKEPEGEVNPETGEEPEPETDRPGVVNGQNGGDVSGSTSLRLAYSCLAVAMVIIKGLFA